MHKVTISVDDDAYEQLEIHASKDRREVSAQVEYIVLNAIGLWTKRKPKEVTKKQPKESSEQPPEMRTAVGGIS